MFCYIKVYTVTVLLYSLQHEWHSYSFIQVHESSCGMAGNGSRSESVSGLAMKSQLQVTGKCLFLPHDGIAYISYLFMGISEAYQKKKLTYRVKYLYIVQRHFSPLLPELCFKWRCGRLNLGPAYKVCSLLISCCSPSSLDRGSVIHIVVCPHGSSFPEFSCVCWHLCSGITESGDIYVLLTTDFRKWERGEMEQKWVIQAMGRTE